jgi:hypothetical protein
MTEMWQRHIAGDWGPMLENFKTDPNADGYYFYNVDEQCFMFSDMKTAIYFKMKIS